MSLPPTGNEVPTEVQHSSQPLPTDLLSPSASLKPLLSPLQTDNAPSMSTIVEPPRSPKAADPASVEVGNGVSNGVENGTGLGNSNGEILGGQADIPNDGSLPPTSSLPTLIMSSEQPSLPPLPVDAPLPPTPPEPKDEVLPTPPADLIPPAVPTPSVITVEDPLKSAPGPVTPPPDIIPGSFPTPSGTQFDPIAPSLAPAPAPGFTDLAAAPTLIEPSSSSDAMDVDDVIGMSAASSTGSLKRAAGEDLDEREEKRVKEDVAASTAPPPPTQPTQPFVNIPTIPGQPVIIPPWQTYVAPPRRPAGPSTPLTVTQHRHLSNTVRTLKKGKDAGVFHLPVDVAAFKIPHYPQIVTKPMDLGTVETKLAVSDPRGPPKDKSKLVKWDEGLKVFGSYSTAGEVIEDVRQIWENTRIFNGPDHFVTLIADKLDETFEKAVNNMPPEPSTYVPAPYVPSPAPIPASPAAGPSSARRASISQPPTIRRTSDGPDSRPKREIHPPPPKDLIYAEGGQRKPKRRNDPQLQWVSRTLKALEANQRNYEVISPFLYPVENIINELPEYRNIIRKPIDLNHIKARLADGEYDEVNQVNRDMKLMAENAMKFNPPGHAVHTAAQQLLQIWEEKWRLLPAKQESRDSSLDPLGGDYAEGDESDDDEIRGIQAQITVLQQRLNEARARKRSKPKTKKPTKAPKARRQSTSKVSPGLNGNGNSKKGRKSFRDEEDLESEEDSGGVMSMTQKQELAEKIQLADESVLAKAIQIIQQTTNVGANNEEIELDIDSLPPNTVSKLYNLVCRGGKKSRRPKGSGPAANKKPGRKAGGVRKSMDESAEAERIRIMEAQLQSFDTGLINRPVVPGYEGEDDSDSSDEEDSDDDE